MQGPVPLADKHRKSLLPFSSLATSGRADVEPRRRVRHSGIGLPDTDRGGVGSLLVGERCNKPLGSKPAHHRIKVVVEIPAGSDQSIGTGEADPQLENQALRINSNCSPREPQDRLSNWTTSADRDDQLPSNPRALAF